VGIEASFFDVLGVKPLLGRTFRPREGAAGEARVAVLSYGFWERHYGGDRSVVDRTVELNAERFAFVGVMQAGFDYPKDPEIWAALDMSPQSLGPPGSHSYLAVGRLKPGVSVSQALSDVTLIARRLEQQYPGSNDKVGAAIMPLKEQLTRGSREPLLILAGAVALVLLIACANVANLLLIRAGGRRRELAIRCALGAGRWRVVRELLTESVLLAVAGAAAGVAAAWWGVRLLQSVKSLPIPLLNPVRVDLPVLVFALAAACITGLLFGILPALQASALRPGEELKSSSHAMLGTGTRRRRLRDGIAVAEIALSLALLVGAGLLLRTFDKMRHAEIGADTHAVLTMGINLPPARVLRSPARPGAVDPGIRTAALSTQIPLESGNNGYPARIPPA
jgi:putative ABC transport system permease protein